MTHMEEPFARMLLVSGAWSSGYVTSVIRFARLPHHPYRPQPIGTGAVLNPVPLALVPMSSRVYGRRRPWRVSARPVVSSYSLT